MDTMDKVYMAQIDDLFKMMAAKSASDFCISHRAPPYLRIRGNGQTRTSSPSQ